MTWDLYLMDRYLKIWKTKDALYETLLVTDDSVLRAVLRLSIEVQKTAGFSAMAAHLDDGIFEILEPLLKNPNDQPDRVYGTDAWNIEHRKTLTQQMEQKLFS